MATMFQSWSMLTVVAVLAVQLCSGDKSCVLWSSAGPVVQRGSSFKVYCTFNCKCKGSMYSDHPPTKRRHQEFNLTTIYFDVVNISKNTTYSCQCNCRPALDPCGLDISAGYLLDRPKNISCIYKVMKNESGLVVCTWNGGRDTYLWNSSVLWVTTVPANHTNRSVSFNVSSKGTELLSASFALSRSVQVISVWVQAQNPLGSIESSITNYTLSDIAMPSAPVLGQPECSSRECVVKVEQPVRTEHLEIQYRAEQLTWTTYPDSVVQMRSTHVWSISSLEPYRLYHFRARSKFSTGLWSQWSANTSSWTQEEAPAKELDVWFTEPASDFKSMGVYWKEANISISRGKIIEYEVHIHRPKGITDVTNVSADARSYSVPFCENCEVTVRARNSKGLSPPARITTRPKKGKPLQNVRETADNHSVTISWRKPETAPLPTAYVVEWYPEGHKLEELRWVRLGKNNNHTVLSGIQPFECYEGAVYAFYDEGSVSRTGFKGVATLQSAPAVSPLIEKEVEGNKVKITWTELPRGQRGGCITNYTIYLENGSGFQERYSVPASERTYIFKDLSPAVYTLWMTASTAEGEGPVGDRVYIVQETQLSFLLICGVVILITMFLVCLCQISVVKQRFWEFFQCLMLDVVPDPANSKWAKECTQEKGKMNLQLQLSNSSVTEEEEEPILVDVEELPGQNSDTSTPTNISSQLPPQTSLRPDTQPGTLLYPLTTYIKSLSQNSDSSDHTQTSLDTNTTVDYISSHGLGNMDEEDEEEEEEFAEMHFFASHNIFMESLEFGGKLTLDALKIECSDFFQNT